MACGDGASCCGPPALRSLLGCAVPWLLVALALALRLPCPPPLRPPASSDEGGSTAGSPRKCSATGLHRRYHPGELPRAAAMTTCWPSPACSSVTTSGPSASPPSLRRRRRLAGGALRRRAGDAWPGPPPSSSPCRPRWRATRAGLVQMQSEFLFLLLLLRRPGVAGGAWRAAPPPTARRPPPTHSDRRAPLASCVRAARWPSGRWRWASPAASAPTKEVWLVHAVALGCAWICLRVSRRLDRRAGAAAGAAPAPLEADRHRRRHRPARPGAPLLGLRPRPRRHRSLLRAVRHLVAASDYRGPGTRSRGTTGYGCSPVTSHRRCSACSPPPGRRSPGRHRCGCSPSTAPAPSSLTASSPTRPRGASSRSSGRCCSSPPG